jgi:hypothetical protein
MKLYVYAISAKIVSFSYLHPWKFIIIYANTSFACHVVHGLSNIIHRELHKIKCTPTCRKGRGSSKVSTWKRFLNYRRHPLPFHFGKGVHLKNEHFLGFSHVKNISVLGKYSYLIWRKSFHIDKKRSIFIWKKKPKYMLFDGDRLYYWVLSTYFWEDFRYNLRRQPEFWASFKKSLILIKI